MSLFSKAAVVSAVVAASALFASPAQAAEVGAKEWSVAVHASGLVHSANRDSATLVGGLELDIGFGLLPRFRIEGVGSALFDVDDTDRRQYMLGARPLVRLGGILGDFEVGGTVYGAFGGYYGRDENVSVVFAPHLRYTLGLLSVYYEPLFFTDQSFSSAVDDLDDTVSSSRFYPVRFGVGLQF